VFSNQLYFNPSVMPRFLARATLAAFLIAINFARAQTAAPEPASAAPFTLEECIARAMKKNFDLQIQDYSTAIARENLEIAKGDFDPNLSASNSRSISNGTGRTVFFPDGSTAQLSGDSNSTNVNVGVSQKLPQTNGTISLSSGLSRQSTQNPPYNGSVTATVSQPLLKNFGPTVAKANIETNKLGVSIALLNYKSQVLTVVRNTENAYYSLVSARETLRIRKLSLALAQALYDENVARRTSGVMTDLDVATAELGVANANLAVIQANQGVRTAEDSLQQLINADNFDAPPGQVMFPDYTDGVPAFAPTYKLVRENFPDTLSTADQIKQLEISLAVAKQNNKASLNLDASFQYGATDSSYGSAYGDALDSFPHLEHDTRRIALTYTMPWGRRADNARYRSASASLSQQKIRLDQLEQSLLVQVRTSVRAVETNLASVGIASKAAELSAKQYDLQKARFDAGLSTSRLVLQAQDDLETARLNELTAKVALRTSVAELHRLDGTSLQRFRIQFPQ